jgi:hypothetical protein
MLRPENLAIAYQELEIYARCRAGSRRPPPVVFVHVPRTGGTSFRRSLAFNCHQWFALGVRHPRDTVSPEAWRLYFENDGPLNPPAPPWNTSPFGFSGHITLDHPFFREIRHPFAAITLLRDPVDRMISHYAFHKGLPPASANGFTDAILKEKMDLPSYCARFAGVDQSILHQFQHFMRGDEDSMGHAIANLEQSVALFGFTDRMAEFLSLLQRHLGFQDIGIDVRRNTSQANQVAVDAAARAELARLLSVDIEFVRRAEEKYRKRRGAL